MSTTSRRCPLCQFRADEQIVYRHLQTSHRKSELCQGLLALSPNEADWMGEKFVEVETSD